MNRDRLINMSSLDAARSTMAVVDALQDFTPEKQLTALAAGFMLACEHHGVAPQDMFQVTTNLMHFADGQRPEFRAVKAYMQNEWTGSPASS